MAERADRVVLAFDSPALFVEAFLACQLLGWIAVPAPAVSLRRGTGRLGAIVQAAQPRAVLCEPSGAAAVAAALEAVSASPLVRPLEAIEREDEVPGAYRMPAPHEVSFVQFTSGSTSAPRGVVLTHANVVHNQRVIEHTFGHGPHTVFVGWLPLFHDMGLIGNLLQPLWLGVHTVLMPTAGFLRSPGLWLRLIGRYGATTSGAPDFAYRLCTERVSDDELASLHLGSWQVAFNGAEPIDAGTMSAFAARFSPAGFDSRAFRPCYGLAESTLMVAGEAAGQGAVVQEYDRDALRAGQALAVREDSPARALVSCGSSPPDVSIRIVDPLTETPLAPRQVGEIWVASASVATRYWNAPQASRETLRAALAGMSVGPRFLRSGDLGFVDEAGRLFVTGRRKEVLILQGGNLHPHDLESAASTGSSLLGDAIAVQLEEAPGRPVLLLLELRREARGSVDNDALRGAVEAVRQRVFAEEGVALANVVIVPPNALPRTSSGKKRRAAAGRSWCDGTLKVLWSDAPDSAGALAAREPEAGADEAHAVLAELLAEVLGKSALQRLPLVSRGVDSVKAAELALALEVRGVTCPVDALLGATSLEELMAACSQEVPSAGKTRQDESLPEADDGGARVASELLALNAYQYPFWLAQQLRPDSAASNVRLAVEISGGPASAQAWTLALGRVVQQHPMLRATLPALPKDPSLRIHPGAEWSVRVCRARDAAHRGELVRELANTVFPTEHGALFRAQLIDDPDGGRALVLVAHHMVIDMHGVALLLQSLLAQLGGAAVSAAGLPGDDLHPLRQAQARIHTASAAHAPWWRDHLAHPPTTELPREDAQGADPTGLRGRRYLFRIDAAVARKLRSACAQARVTPMAGLLAAYRLLLLRFTGQRDAIVGVPANCRVGPAEASLVSCFVNPLPLRLRLDPQMSAEALLVRTGEVLGEARIRADRVAAGDRHLESSGEADAPVTLTTMLSLQSTAVLASGAGLALGEQAQPVTLGEVTLRACDMGDIDVPFALAMMLAEEADGSYLAAFEYRLAAYAQSTIALLAESYCRLLEAITDHPTRAICELPMLGEADQAWLQQAQAPATLLAVADACAHWSVEEQAGRTPAAIALRSASGELTYEALELEAAAAAHGLRQIGLRENAVVGVMMPAGEPLICALLAIWKCRAVYVPLDPAAPSARLASMIRGAGVELLITGSEALEASSGISCTQIAWDALPRKQAPWIDRRRRREDPSRPAYITFTSGSTGTPKGVVVSHRALCNFGAAQRQRLGMRSLRRVLQITPPVFDAFFSDVLMALAGGGSLCIPPEGARLPCPALAEYIRAQRISLITATASMLELMEPSQYPDLQAIISMGEPCPAATVQRWSRQCAYYNGYGPTEAAIGATLGRCDGTPSGTRTGAPSVGRPFANYALFLLDEHLQQVPPGAVGEVYIAGAGVASHYCADPSLTAERFVPNPFATTPGQRMYRTGDLMRWLPSGELEFVDRVDRQLKLRGVRVEPGEVEAVLRRYPGVREAFVELERESSSGPMLVAYLVGDDTLQGKAVQDHVRRHLPAAMRPGRLYSVANPTLGAHGKLDKRALRDLAQPLTGDTGADRDRATGTQDERSVHEAWAKVLGSDGHGLDENFFDCGGHSLLLPQLQLELERRTGRSLALVELFTQSTVRAQAKALGAASSAQGAATLSPPRQRELQTAPPAEHGSADIAVIGVACRLPDADDVASFWRNILAGRESVQHFSPQEFTPPVDAPSAAHFVPARAILHDVDLFDDGFFNYSAQEAAVLDPQKRLLLELSQQALDDAACAPAQAPGCQPVGVFAGTSRSQYRSLVEHHASDAVARLGELKIGIANDPGSTATLIAYKLNLTGPSLTTDTACSTGLVAIHQACTSLRAGECRMALAAAASIDVPVVGGHYYERGSIASPDGHCRPYDAKAGGTVKGMGGGVVVLKRLQDALDDGDPIHAVICGSAVNNDGAAKMGFTAPSTRGQAEVIARALHTAGIEPSALAYVEGHGTGTELGDAIEVTALNEALAERAPPRSIAIGSVKSNIGHLDAAAGMAGFIKALLVVKHGRLPPQALLEEPNSALAWDAGPLYVNRESAPWPRSGLRYAAVSSFGIGGTNAHMVLRDAPESLRTPASANAPVLVPISAASGGALTATATRLAQALRAQPTLALDDVAATLAQGRRHLPHRRYAVVRDVDELVTALESPTQAPVPVPVHAPQLVGVFPGHGMDLRDVDFAGLISESDCFASALQDALAQLPGAQSLSFDTLAASDPTALRSRLSTDPALTQPLLLATQLALYALAQDWGLSFDAVIGHSFGELAAACVSGLADPELAMAFAAARGEATQACGAGAMLAVAGEAPTVRALLEPGVSIAAENGECDCVVSGDADVLARLQVRLTSEGIPWVALATDRAFHSPAMQTAVDVLAQSPPALGVGKAPEGAPAMISTITGDWVSQLDDRHWLRHLTQPVRFKDATAAALGTGPCVFVELGPARTVTGLLARQRHSEIVAVQSLMPAGGPCRETLLRAFGGLWTLGLCQPRAGGATRNGQRTHLPGVAFERRSAWIEGVPLYAGSSGDREQVHATATTASAPASGDAHQARTHAQQVWCELLGVPSVEDEDDFLALGGDSLLAVRFSTELGARLQRKLAPKLALEQRRFSRVVGALGLDCDDYADPSVPPHEVLAADELDIDRPRPLTPQQLGLWLAHQMEGADAALNLQLAVELHGPLDAQRLQEALRKLLQRHSVLRTTFVSEAGAVRQRPAHAPQALHLERVGEVTATALDEHLRQASGASFDIGRDLLLRAQLLTLGEQRHVLALTVHHLVADGRSLVVLMEELVALYADPSVTLAPAPSYGRSAAQMPAAGEPAPAAVERELPWVELPADFSAPEAAGDVACEVASVRIGSDLARRLNDVCARTGVTRYSYLLAVLMVLARRTIDQEEVVIASPVDLRDGDEDQRTVGPFVHLAAWHRRIPLGARFDQLLAQTAGEVARVLAGPNERGEPTTYRSARTQAGGGAPFGLAFAVNHPVAPVVRVSEELEARPRLPTRAASRFDCMLWVDVEPDDLRLSFEYRVGRYRSSTMERYAQAMRRLLAASLAQPQGSIDEYALYAPTIAPVLGASHASARATGDAPISLQIAARAEQMPEQLAMRHEGRDWTLGEVHSAALKLAAALRDAGVAPMDAVGVCLPRSPDLIVAVLGVLYAGAAFVPLDPALPRGRVASLVREASLRVAISDGAVPALSAMSDLHVLVLADSRAPEPARAFEQLPPPTVPPANAPAYVMFTSGTTGRPKGVLVEHSALANQCRWMIEAFAIDGADRVLYKTPISFDVALWEVFVPLLSGAVTVIAPPDAHEAPEQLARLLAQERITMVHFVPSLLALYLEQQTARMEHLRVVLLSGEALASDLARRARQHAPAAQIANLYGPTEATIHVSDWRFRDVDEAMAPIGRPISNVRLYVLDESLSPLPVGMAGELYIAGAGLARGYLGRPELTASAFLPDPQHAGERMYRTGDRARWRQDGELEYLGRADRQLKLHGVRIEPGEIEALARQHESVAAVAVGVTRSGGGERLVAHVVPASDHAPRVCEALRPSAQGGDREATANTSAVAQEAEQLKAGLLDSLREQLSVHMVPGKVVLCDRFPLTASGKLDRERLPQDDPWSRAPARAPARPRLATGALIDRIAQLWSQILGGDAPRLETNFFEAGGNSLGAIRLCEAVSREFACNADLRALVQHPTLAGFAALMERQLEDGEAHGRAPTQWPQLPADPARRHEPFPMTQLQRAYQLGRSAQLQLGNVATHGYLEIEAPGLDLRRFVAAFNALIARHDMLRAVAVDEGSLEIVAEVDHYEPIYSDLAALGPEAQSDALQTIREQMAHTVFELERWPAFEVRITRLDARQHRVHFSLDALAVDGTSALVLERDLNALYAAEAGEGPTPPPLPQFSYRDYTLGLAKLREQDAYRSARGYWLKRLDSLPRAPSLPLRVALGDIETPRFQRRQFTLDAARWRAAQDHAARAGITPTALVLSAYSEVLARWSGDEHFLVNLPVLSRPPVHPRVDELVGNFSNTLLLEVDARDITSFGALAKRVHTQLWNDLAHVLYDGVELQRVRARQQRSLSETQTPIVFTGLLGPLVESAETPTAIDLRRDVFGLSQTSQVLLDCLVLQRPNGLVLSFDAVEDAFPAGMLDAMFKHLRERLLRVAQVGLGAATEDLLEPQISSPQVRVEAPAAPSHLLDGLLRAGRRAPDDLAVVASDRTLTFSELLASAAGLAGALQRDGLRREEPVAIAMDRGWEQVVAAVAVTLAGGAYVPIDLSMPSERTRSLLASAGANRVLVQANNANALGSEGLRRFVVEAQGPQADAHAMTLPTPSQLAYIIFTSGSTGRPKGVAMEHGPATNTLESVNRLFGVTREDVVLGVSALGFDLSVYDVFGVLGNGARLVLPHADRAKDPASWARLMKEHRVSLWNSVPALLGMLLEHLEPHGDRAAALRHLRVCLLSGDWIPLDLAPRLGALAPDCRMVSLGGATEAAVWSIYHPIDAVDPSWTSIPYGKPLPGQDLVVLDPQLRPCPTWVTGQLHISGAGLARGYWGDEQSTERAFIQHPRTGVRLYRTGDLGRWLPDGNIEFLGRQDTQVKLRGLRLELGEVEAHLEAHRQVARAVVVAERSARRTGRLVAYLTMTADSRAGESPSLGVSGELQEARRARWSAALEAARTRAQGAACAGEVDQDVLREHLSVLEGRYRAALVNLFTQLKRVQHPGERIQVEQICYEEGIARRYHRWVSRACAYLADQGLLQRCEDASYVVSAPIGTLSCLGEESLPVARLLREELHSASLYATDEMAQSYQQHFDSCHDLASAAVRAYVAAAAESGPMAPTPVSSAHGGTASPHRAGLRVLEIGAGFGSLTEHVAPIFAEGACEEYRFTDISRYFLDRAEQQFAQHDAVVCGMFDMDVAPELQGYRRHHYDVIIAASALHNATHLRRTLQFIRSLLVPGGFLLLVEETRFFPFFDLGMGLQQGFDGFDDPEREVHPLLGAQQWLQTLGSLGFRESTVLSHPDTAAAVLGFDVIVAQAPTRPTSLDEDLLRAHLAQRLPRVAIPSVWVALEEMPLNANGKIDRGALQPPAPTELAVGEADGTNFVAPRTDTERELAQIIAACTGAERVGVTDNFFELGGDSLVAAQVVSEMRERLAVDVSLEVLFEATTVEALAAQVALLRGASGPAAAESSLTAGSEQ